MNLALARDWVAMKLGYRRLYYLNYDPPNHLIKEIPGVDGADPTFVRPKGILKTEVVIYFSLGARLRLLFSGKVQVVSVAWLVGQPEALGDAINWTVLPPYDKVDPKLKI